MQTISHSNCVNIIMANVDGIYTHRDGRKEDVMYILMEYVPNGELIEYLIQTGGFTDKIVRTYFI